MITTVKQINIPFSQLPFFWVYGESTWNLLS